MIECFQMISRLIRKISTGRGRPLRLTLYYDLLNFCMQGVRLPVHALCALILKPRTSFVERSSAGPLIPLFVSAADCAVPPSKLQPCHLHNRKTTRLGEPREVGGVCGIKKTTRQLPSICRIGNVLTLAYSAEALSRNCRAELQLQPANSSLHRRLIPLHRIYRTDGFYVHGIRIHPRCPLYRP